MKNILIAGAGKSSTSLIQYMLQHSEAQQWKVTVMDAHLEAIEEKIQHHPNGTAVAVDIHNEAERKQLVKKADIVLSVMPPHLHYLLALDCLEAGKHLITSSYVSEDIRALDGRASEQQLLFMCEMGCDPGIDHMSTAKIFDHIHEQGGEILSFKSCCGGLVAPESDTNKWHYKISWNPHNVVTAAQAGAIWYEDNKVIQRDYKDIFKYPGAFHIDGLEDLAYYPNRDSLKYKDIFNVPGINTFVRATLRHKDFMHGWQKIVDLNLTNEHDSHDAGSLTYRSWIAAVNRIAPDELEKVLTEQYGFDALAFGLFRELGLLSDTPVSTEQESISSAGILQRVIEKAWKLEETDKDMIVMQHLVTYTLKEETIEHESSLIVKGENRLQSAMAKTVGLPMAILAHKILDGTIDTTAIHGVQIPIRKEIYSVVLPLLEAENIKFIDKEKVLI